MKVVLYEENRVMEVADGYARNYLFPKKLAAPATEANLAAFEKQKAKRQAVIDSNKAAAKEMAEKLEAAKVVIKADAGEEGKLFGSVTSLDIAQAIKDLLGLEIDKRKIIMDGHIKVVGESEVSVKLFPEVSARVKVVVEPK
ncbi:MAG: 50S ribosomal protein L9 [Candidatus Margulisbacteria bacterium]|nr:50S ribosomal protein L9 [Candidatus Margulisiibacteriota bacterium]